MGFENKTKCFCFWKKDFTHLVHYECGMSHWLTRVVLLNGTLGNGVSKDSDTWSI